MGHTFCSIEQLRTMAKDTQSKKRKASVPEVEAEKVKKVKNAVATPSEAPAKKRKATDDAAPTKMKKTKTPKDTSEVKAATPTDKAPKKSSSTLKEALKDSKKAPDSTKKQTAEPKKTNAVSAKKTASKEKADKLAKPEIEADEELDSGLEDEDKDMDEVSDSEPDDQTKAMLKGFESDGDDDEVDDGLPEGTAVPVRKQLSKKEEKKLAKIKESEASEKPGVVYIGRIPHGFYENEMRAYFGQFGKILQLRMSRNKKTGAGKHYGWIKFESSVVADIVARTMDNYLMFGHILKVKLIPEEQVNEAWFKGANKRFKKVPWNKMQGRNLEQGKSEETWNTKVEQEAEKREKTAKKGKKAKNTQAGVSKEENQAVTIPPTKEDVAESINDLIAEVAEKPKKGKKVKVVKATEAVVDEPAVVATEESTESKPKKEKKVKKTKIVETAETSEAAVPEPEADIPEKKLKTKKSKTSLVETTVAPVAAPEETG